MKKYSIAHKIISVIPVVLLLAAIFYFSSQTASESGQVSSGFSRTLVRSFGKLTGRSLTDTEIELKASSFEFLIRKLAHISEFFLLALLSHYAMATVCTRRLSLVNPDQSSLVIAKFREPSYIYKSSQFLNIGERILLVFLFVFLCAALDEFHQTFVPGRSGAFVDVLIDSIGNIAGALVALLVHKIKSK